jgi:hypothetical protein
LTVAIAASCLLGSAGATVARVFPGRGPVVGLGPLGPITAAAVRNYADGGYGYGGYGYEDYGQTTYNFINNSPVGNYMQPAPPPVQGEIDPAASTAGYPNAGQADQDWWSQYEGRQMAAERARGYGTTPAAARGMGFEPAYSPPKAALDIIKWPILLQRPTFAPYRARIESPYRRTPPRLSTPTAEDYRAIIETADEMQDKLEWMLEDGLETDQYNQAKSFLNAIQQDARDYLERAARKSQTPKS